MLSFSKKNILLGVTGGIAAYKSAEIIRLFKKLGADVRVVMTESAKEFITPLTLQAISGNEIHDSLLNTEAEAAMGHIELAVPVYYEHFIYYVKGVLNCICLRCKLYLYLTILKSSNFQS